MIIHAQECTTQFMTIQEKVKSEILVIVVVPRWFKMYDPESKWQYYVKNDTGVNTWERARMIWSGTLN